MVRNIQIPLLIHTYTCMWCTYSSNWKFTTYPHSMSVCHTDLNKRWMKKGWWQRWRKSVSVLVSLSYSFTCPFPLSLLLFHFFSFHFSKLFLLFSPTLPFASLCQLVTMWPRELLWQADKGNLSVAKREGKDLKVTHIPLPSPLCLSASSQDRYELFSSCYYMLTQFTHHCLVFI